MAPAAVRMMAAMRRGLRAGAGALLCLSALSCGGGDSGLGPSPPPPTDANVASVIVDAGPGDSSVNTLFTSVTLCVPGTTTCQTIDHIQVDTASFGLRILAPALTLSLPVQTTVNGTLAECMVFADGYSWGPVAQADIQIAGEFAASVPVHVIGDPNYTHVPEDCASLGPVEEDTVATFGANGILGIGVFAQDCGMLCVNTASSQYYYSCSTVACVPTTVPLANQVPNPVSLFAVDNNGSIIDLPSVTAQGALSVTGSLIFGIDTQSNNASGNVTVLAVDPDFGNITAIYKGQSLNQSFIDAGSNGNYFSDSTIPQCTDTNLSGFYCPAGTLNLTVTLQGVNGTSAPVNFGAGNAQTMLTNNPSFTAFPQLAGTTPVTDSFDFGLPFFYGRRVSTALESGATAVGKGPYIAF